MGLKVNETFELLSACDDDLKQAISRNITDFSSEIRNISHRMNSKILEQHPIAPLLRNLCGESARYGKLNLQYDIGEPVAEIPVQITIHVYRIIQELLNNARKYAPTSKIIVTVKFNEHDLEIEYNDDGPGFSTDKKGKQGMGISNIFARVNLLNGSTTLDTVPGHGVYWRFTAPL